MGSAKRFDEGQLQAIRADETAIVSAGAGSGKTTVLSARYLRLVRDRGFPIDSILALTFTRKATSEMFARIHAELSREESEPVRRQLERFGDARISTFDSFCARIARSGCAAWGFSPDFAVDDGRALELAEAQALRFVLERRGEGSLRRLVARHGLERTCREILAGASLRMCPARPLDFAAMPAELEAFLRAELSRARERLAGIRDAALAEGNKKARATYPALFEAELPEAGSEAFLALCDSLAAIRRIGSNQDFHEESREIKESICLPAAMAGRSLRALPEYAPAYALLDEYQGRIIEAKRAANVLSFLDSAQMAREVLLSDAALRSFYKERIRAIMVDEFQDDNNLQKEILYLLAEDPRRRGRSVPGPGEVAPGKLFFVGDEKQSIYRFRGADVSVFRRLGRELGPAAREIELSMNYRSEPRLIEFFNAVFPRVMGGAERDFEARYAPIGARGPTEGIAPSILRLSYLPPEEEGDGDLMEPKDCEAWGIARFIEDSCEGGRSPLLVPDGEGGARPARHGDFAVLFRATTHQEKLERFLRLLRLPFRSVDLCAFYREAPTIDLYLAMRCALYPGDSGALAAYLRSPFAALSDPGIASLLSDPGFRGWRSLSDPGFPGAAALDGADADKAARALATLEAVKAMADREPISSIVAYLWHQAGYRHFLLARERNHAYLEYFDFLFALADEADKDGRCLALFVEDLERRIAEGERLRESDPPREEGGGVKLMTIHKAKGLEFPIVILPGIDSAGRDRDSGDLIHWWREGCLTLKMGGEDEEAEDYFHASCEAERKEMALAEQKRLLYVACTRAECHLVFTECSGGRQDRSGASFRSLLDLALDSSAAAPMVEARSLPGLARTEYYRLLSRAEGAAPETDKALEACRAAAPLERRPLRRDFTATELNAAYADSLGLSFSPEDREDGDAGDGAGEGAEGAPAFSGAAFGSLVHALIQAELEGGGGQGRLPPGMESILEGHEDPEALMAQARAAAEAFLGSPLRRRLDGAAWRRAEYPFLLRKEDEEGEYFVSGVIDLIAAGEGECVVVDYKTNGARREGEYELQMSLYREAARALTGARTARSYLFYLRAGGAFEAAADVDPAPFLPRRAGTPRR